MQSCWLVNFNLEAGYATPPEYVEDHGGPYYLACWVLHFLCLERQGVFAFLGHPLTNNRAHKDTPHMYKRVTGP